MAKEITQVEGSQSISFMTEVQEFKYESQNIRTVYLNDEIWFVGLDICNVLEIKNPSDAFSRLNRADLGTTEVSYGSQFRNLVIVNESGLYDIVLDSRKPEAKQFRRWITKDVLPAIRKTGQYQLPDIRNLSEEDKRSIIRLEIKEHNKGLANEAQKAGVGTTGNRQRDTLEFAIFQDSGYRGLYNGLTAKNIHTQKGLKKSQKILDHMGSEELAANFFRVTQTEAKLKRESVHDRLKANEVHFDMGKKVRQFILDQGGTPPENLPAYNKVKKLGAKSPGSETSLNKPISQIPDKITIDVSKNLWVAALWLMYEKPGGVITTKELREEIPKRINIDSEYLEYSKTKKELKIEQIIRNLKSNKKNKTNFINQGYVLDIRGGFQITKKGLEFVKEEFKEFL